MAPTNVPAGRILPARSRAVPAGCTQSGRYRVGLASYCRDVDESGRDLRCYYEAEAEQRVRRTLLGRRVGLVADFIRELESEGRRSVIDIGAGPGLDGEQFVAAGMEYVGVDLALGNARLAAERGVTVLQADLCALPVRHDAFHAAWSMSTLMHLPAERVGKAVRQIADVLQPGSPIVVGVWGGDHGDVVSEKGIPGQRRLFSLRSLDRNAALLANGGKIESTTTWDFGDDAWEYQVFRIRSAPS